MSAEMHRSQDIATVTPEAIVANGSRASKVLKFGHNVLVALRPSAQTMQEAGVLTPHDAHRAETGDFEAINPQDALIAARYDKLVQANPSVYNQDNTPYQG